MARRKTSAFIPSAEYQAAYDRAAETAHASAADLFGELLVADPAEEASPCALMMAMGMMYFLARLSPDDLRGIASEDGIHAKFWKPRAAERFAAPTAVFSGEPGK